MRDKDLYAQILGITSPWQVTEVELGLSQGEVTVHVEREEGAQQCCPSCARVSPGYASACEVASIEACWLSPECDVRDPRHSVDDYQ